MLRPWIVAGILVLAASGTGAVRLLSKPQKPGDGRLMDPEMRQTETKLGRHLFAPTWLPEGMAPVPNFTREGAHRVLCNFADPGNQRGMILAQEPRTPERDQYHKQHILPRTDMEATVGSDTAYFMWGPNSERRLFWRNRENWLVVSSFELSDGDLLKVARSMK